MIDLKNVDIVSSKPISKKWGSDNTLVYERIWISKEPSSHCLNLRGSLRGMSEGIGIKSFGSQTFEKELFFFMTVDADTQLIYMIILLSIELQIRLL